MKCKHCNESMKVIQLFSSVEYECRVCSGAQPPAMAPLMYTEDSVTRRRTPLRMPVRITPQCPDLDALGIPPANLAVALINVTPQMYRKLRFTEFAVGTRGVAHSDK